MKISFMTFACPEWPVEQMLAAARRHGYQGIEFRCDARQAHGVEVWAGKAERRELRRRLEDAGIEPCCLATSLQFASDKALELAPQRVELAADLGCPALRVFCGPKLEYQTMDDVVKTVAERLRHAAVLADAQLVQLWVETHDTFSRAQFAAAAVRQADHRAVGLNWDNMHPFRHGEALDDTLGLIDGLVRHTHFHDALAAPDQVVITPFGKGQMPLDPMFAALVRMGYDGYISGEWFGTMYGKTPDESLAQYREDVAALAARHGVTIG